MQDSNPRPPDAQSNFTAFQRIEAAAKVITRIDIGDIASGVASGVFGKMQARPRFCYPETSYRFCTDVTVPSPPAWHPLT